MAFKEAITNIGHTVLDAFRSHEAKIAQPFPQNNRTPANEPGGSGTRKGCWYRIIDNIFAYRGLLWICFCGQSHAWYCTPNENLQRKLETTHYCCARCASIVRDASDPSGVRRLLHTEKDEHGNVIPVGAPYSLLDMFLDGGAGLSEADRDAAYSLLPTWRIGGGCMPDPRTSRFIDTENMGWDGEVGWDGMKPYGLHGMK